MPAACPKCGGAVSISLVEGFKRVASLSYAFDCPHCGVRLITNYWDPQLVLFRLVFVLSAAILFFGFYSLGVSVELFAACFFVYVLVGWFWLRRYRKVVYADNRLNEAIKQKRQA